MLFVMMFLVVLPAIGLLFKVLSLVCNDGSKCISKNDERSLNAIMFDSK